MESYYDELARERGFNLKTSMTSLSVNIDPLHSSSLNYHLNISGRGVGYMDAVEALLPYRNATNIFLQI
jgi:hypothetical protein